MAKKAVAAGLKFEDAVRGSLKKIGFKDVTGGVSFKVGEYQVDACGGWDDVLLVIECTQTSSEEASVRNKITNLRGKAASLRSAFKKLTPYEKYGRFVFAVATKNIAYKESDLSIAAEKLEIHLIDSQQLDYYHDLSDRIGTGALFNFLGELRIPPKDLTFPTIPAFRVALGKFGPTYLFWTEPKTLLEIAYVARRESGIGHYYQRMVDKGRLQRIGKDFIDKDGVFPNNIIICFDNDKPPTFRRKQGYEVGWPGWLEMGELVFPRSYRSAWIIDGQHRLYAFRGREKNPKVQKLAVFAFHKLRLATQAKFFVDINHEQKPVSQDLIWDLKGDLEEEGSRDWVISRCVKELNGLPPLKGKIFMPLSGKRGRGQLKMSGVCQDIRDSGLVDERSHSMPQFQKNPLVQSLAKQDIPKNVGIALSNFFGVLERNCDEKLWGGILLRPGGMTVALGVYEQILVRLARKPTPDDLETYATAFLSGLMDLAQTQTAITDLRKGLTSYAQRRDVLVEIVLGMQDGLNDTGFGAEITKDRLKFNDKVFGLERQLAQLVAGRLEITELNDLKDKAPEGVWRNASRLMAQERRKYPNFQVHEALSLGDVKQIMERQDNRAKLMPCFLRPQEGFHSEQEVLANLGAIIEARKRVHGRKRGTMSLVNVYMQVFERAVAAEQSSPIPKN